LLDKELATETYTELKKLISQTFNDPIKKWQLNIIFSKKEVQLSKNTRNTFIITVHKGNANQIHTKIPCHSCWNSYQEHSQQQILVRMWDKRNPYSLLVEM
jgi:hypothetical protein